MQGYFHSADHVDIVALFGVYGLIFDAFFCATVRAIPAMDLRTSTQPISAYVFHTITLCAMHYRVKYVHLPAYLCVFQKPASEGKMHHAAVADQ
jgi:hypothetical protein